MDLTADKIEYNVPGWHKLIIAVLTLVTLGCFGGMFFDEIYRDGSNIEHWADVAKMSLWPLGASLVAPLFPSLAKAVRRHKASGSSNAESNESPEVEELRKLIGQDGASILLDRIRKSADSQA